MCKINGVKLTEMRKKAGMSQKTLAKQIGVAESTISNYETGRTDPTDVTLRKMSVIFKVDPKDLEIDEKVLLAKAIINGKRDLRNVKSKELTPMETQELFEKLRNYNEKFAEEEVEKAKTAYQNFFGKKYSVVQVAALNVPDWQRNTNITKATEIAEHYDENKYDPVKVYIYNGKFYIADGAHRAVLFIIAGKKFILVEILENVSEETALDTFLEQSLGRKKMTQNDMWRAAIEKGLPQYVELRNMAMRNNIQVLVDKEKIKNPVAVVSASWRLLQLSSKEGSVLERIFDLLGKLEWCGSEKANPYATCVLYAFDKLYALYKGHEVAMESILIRKCKGVVYYNANIAITRSSAKIFDELSEVVASEINK